MQQAIRHREYLNTPLTHYSHRGLQYCCNEYQQVLNDGNIACSMTESDDPYQNAIAERINGFLKHEFILGIITSDVGLMRKLIDQSIDIYNHERPHWSCWMNTPNFMHQQQTIKYSNETFSVFPRIYSAVATAGVSR